MTEGNWRAWAGQLIYRRPYEDAWGTLHDPTTERDELFKYYQPWVMLLVDEGTHRIARSASTEARELIREERNAARIDKLEADYLERNSRRKQWKRRKKRAKGERSKVPVQAAQQVMR